MSFESCNPKVVFTAAVVLFNHLLCFKRDKNLLKNVMQDALSKIVETISNVSLNDIEAIMGLLLCECRIMFLNRPICEYVLCNIDSKFKDAH